MLKWTSSGKLQQIPQPSPPCSPDLSDEHGPDSGPSLGEQIAKISARSLASDEHRAQMKSRSFREHAGPTNYESVSPRTFTRVRSMTTTSSRPTMRRYSPTSTPNSPSNNENLKTGDKNVRHQRSLSLPGSPRMSESFTTRDSRRKKGKGVFKKFKNLFRRSASKTKEEFSSTENISGLDSPELVGKRTKLSAASGGKLQDTAPSKPPKAEKTRLVKLIENKREQRNSARAEGLKQTASSQYLAAQGVAVSRGRVLDPRPPKHHRLSDLRLVQAAHLSNHNTVGTFPPQGRGSNESVSSGKDQRFIDNASDTQDSENDEDDDEGNENFQFPNRLCIDRSDRSVQRQTDAHSWRSVTNLPYPATATLSRQHWSSQSDSNMPPQDKRFHDNLKRTGYEKILQEHLAETNNGSDTSIKEYQRSLLRKNELGNLVMVKVMPSRPESIIQARNSLTPPNLRTFTGKDGGPVAWSSNKTQETAPIPFTWYQENNENETATLVESASGKKEMHTQESVNLVPKPQLGPRNNNNGHQTVQMTGELTKIDLTQTNVCIASSGGNVTDQYVLKTGDKLFLQKSNEKQQRPLLAENYERGQTTLFNTKSYTIMNDQRDTQVEQSNDQSRGVKITSQQRHLLAQNDETNQTTLLNTNSYTIMSNQQGTHVEKSSIERSRSVNIISQQRPLLTQSEGTYQTVLFKSKSTVVMKDGRQTQVDESVDPSSGIDITSQQRQFLATTDETHQTTLNSKETSREGEDQMDKDVGEPVDKSRSVNIISVAHDRAEVYGQIKNITTEENTGFDAIPTTNEEENVSGTSVTYKINDEGSPHDCQLVRTDTASSNDKDNFSRPSATYKISDGALPCNSPLRGQTEVGHKPDTSASSRCRQTQHHGSPGESTGFSPKITVSIASGQNVTQTDSDFGIISELPSDDTSEACSNTNITDAESEADKWPSLASPDPSVTGASISSASDTRALCSDNSDIESLVNNIIKDNNISKKKENAVPVSGHTENAEESDSLTYTAEAKDDSIMKANDVENIKNDEQCQVMKAQDMGPTSGQGSQQPDLVNIQMEGVEDLQQGHPSKEESAELTRTPSTQEEGIIDVKAPDCMVMQDCSTLEDVGDCSLNLLEIKGTIFESRDEEVAVRQEQDTVQTLTGEEEALGTSLRSTSTLEKSNVFQMPICALQEFTTEMTDYQSQMPKPKKRVSFKLDPASPESSQSDHQAVIEVTPVVEGTVKTETLHPVTHPGGDLGHEDDLAATDDQCSFSDRSNDAPLTDPQQITPQVTPQITSASADDVSWWGPEVLEDMEFFYDYDVKGENKDFADTVKSASPENSQNTQVHATGTNEGLDNTVTSESPESVLDTQVQAKKVEDDICNTPSYQPYESNKIMTLSSFLSGKMEDPHNDLGVSHAELKQDQKINYEKPEEAEDVSISRQVCPGDSETASQDLDYDRENMNTDEIALYETNAKLPLRDLGNQEAAKSYVYSEPDRTLDRFSESMQETEEESPAYREDRGITCEGQGSASEGGSHTYTLMISPQEEYKYDETALLTNPKIITSKVDRQNIKISHDVEDDTSTSPNKTPEKVTSLESQGNEFPSPSEENYTSSPNKTPEDFSMNDPESQVIDSGDKAKKKVPHWEKMGTTNTPPGQKKKFLIRGKPMTRGKIKKLSSPDTASGQQSVSPVSHSDRKSPEVSSPDTDKIKRKLIRPIKHRKLKKGPKKESARSKSPSAVSPISTSSRSKTPLSSSASPEAIEHIRKNTRNKLLAKTDSPQKKPPAMTGLRGKGVKKTPPTGKVSQVNNTNKTPALEMASRLKHMKEISPMETASQVKDTDKTPTRKKASRVKHTNKISLKETVSQVKHTNKTPPMEMISHVKHKNHCKDGAYEDDGTNEQSSPSDKQAFTSENDFVSEESSCNSAIGQVSKTSSLSLKDKKKSGEPRGGHSKEKAKIRPMTWCDKELMADDDHSGYGDCLESSEDLASHSQSCSLGKLLVDMSRDVKEPQGPCDLECWMVQGDEPDPRRDGRLWQGKQTARRPSIMKDVKSRSPHGYQGTSAGDRGQTLGNVRGGGERGCGHGGHHSKLRASDYDYEYITEEGRSGLPNTQHDLHQPSRRPFTIDPLPRQSSIAGGSSSDRSRRVSWRRANSYQDEVGWHHDHQHQQREQDWQERSHSGSYYQQPHSYGHHHHHHQHLSRSATLPTIQRRHKDSGSTRNDSLSSRKKGVTKTLDRQVGQWLFIATFFIFQLLLHWLYAR